MVCGDRSQAKQIIIAIVFIMTAGAQRRRMQVQKTHAVASGKRKVIAALVQSLQKVNPLRGAFRSEPG